MRCSRCAWPTRSAAASCAAARSRIRARASSSCAPVRGEEHRTLDAVRRTDGHWLRPWEATLPPDTLEHIPTFSQYMRRADRDHREGTGLIFGVQIDGRFVGQFPFPTCTGVPCRRACSATGSSPNGRAEAWVPWSRRSSSTSSSASWGCIGSRCVCAPRMSALWVCAEASVSSRRVCAPASCTSVASGPTISLSSSIPSPCPREASCDVGGGVRRSTERRRSFSSWGLPILGSRACRSGANGADVAGVTSVVTPLFTERFESRHAPIAQSLVPQTPVLCEGGDWWTRHCSDIRRAHRDGTVARCTQDSNRSVSRN